MLRQIRNGVLRRQIWNSIFLTLAAGHSFFLDEKRIKKTEALPSSRLPLKKIKVTGVLKAGGFSATHMWFNS
jgi:hypothetical protein